MAGLELRPAVRAVLFALHLLVLLMACSDPEKRYAGLEFDAVSTPPVRARLTSGRLELPAGVAVQVEATILSSDLAYEEKDLLWLAGRNTEVVDVFDTLTSRQFVLVGVNPGKSCLEVRVNHEEEDCIDVEVTAQGD